MSFLKRPLLVLLALALLVSPVLLTACDAAAPATYEKAMAAARNGVWKDINSGKAGSASVAILENGKVVYSEGFGVADREKSTPVYRDTLFNLGSISKVYTAAAIMLLVDEGKGNLDDPVVKHLPEFIMADPRYKDITLRMTLNHSSGLPGTTASGDFGFEYNKDFFRQTLENLSRAHFKHAPGARAPYCNDGFTLAEMVVERISGQRFVEYLNARVFKPLGLKNTGVSIGERPGAAQAAYYNPATGKKQPPEVVSLIGAGGLASTAEDLCRFVDAFSDNGPQIFSAASLAEMRKAQPYQSPLNLKNPEWPYGLGWDMTGLPKYQAAGIQVLGKTGGTGNFTTMVIAVPSLRLSIAVLECSRGGNALMIALDMLDAVLAQKGLLAEKAVTVSKPPAPQPIPPQYAAFAGYYYSLIRVDFDLKQNIVNLTGISKGVESASDTLYYSDGYFYDAEGGRSYFVSLDGRDYYVTASAVGVDSIGGERLKKLDKPLSLKTDMDGKVWLIRNAKPFDGALGVSAHVMKSSLIRDLPGYVDFFGAKEVKSATFAGMAADTIRDQTELTLVDKDGRTWAWLSEMLFSPAETAAVLRAGSQSVTIGSDGYSEWLRADGDLILAFEKPAMGRVIVFSPGGAAQYDSAIDRGEVLVQKGCFIECAGYKGDAFKVNAR
jgi:CubicO group peptidase (beta-lactamase class C family)